MQATKRYRNLLSEKQAAKRLGVARITLLRARGNGRIKFYRIGTRVLYSDQHLADFLVTCERNQVKRARTELETWSVKSNESTDAPY